MPTTKVKKNKEVKEDGLKAVIINTEGKESGKIDLPSNIFDLPWNSDLVHQVVTSMQSSLRTPVAHVKTRGEVRGGGRKPWKQKGTGRARHGSTRSPIWRGGGVTHGPRNDKSFFRKVNKKMKTKAFLTILSEKYRNGEIIFVDSIKMTEPKTKQAVSIIKKFGGVSGLERIGTKKTNTALIGFPEINQNLQKSFRNIGKVKIDNVRNWNPLELLQYKYAIIVEPKESIEHISNRLKAIKEK